MLKIYHSFFWILVILISSCSQQTYNNNNSFLKSGQEPFGPYQPSPDWPKDISTIPGYEKWTWGAIQGVFAERSRRVLCKIPGQANDARGNVWYSRETEVIANVVNMIHHVVNACS